MSGEICDKCGTNTVPMRLIVKADECYRCGTPMRYALIKSDGGFYHLGPPEFSAEERALAAKNGVLLKTHFSRTMGDSYLANTCGKCHTFIGAHYLGTYAAYDFGEDRLAAIVVRHDCEQCWEEE